ncbi:hypothetical protein DICSQDRAFT_155200 [Dichomitus squalens LYAD-421 SS1]|uniref:Uncharacterized protein n=2 Tax=Dichomitus squalens TaxID=114155 RepID=A0A4V2K6J1_9APHY|nr:uncharacterized protein DICSQDRAFT_155200 [Dichomitus squalens LYAD-421 SS1]EJF61475.1 hypothetical protein DICSQDRAFT_155200 [Dichomitus squalens LYAD-421 SS1]TBU52473.1 hypothetical protein BD310DRAFT_940180 [Dichomitus squalens]
MSCSCRCMSPLDQLGFSEIQLHAPSVSISAALTIVALPARSPPPLPQSFASPLCIPVSMDDTEESEREPIALSDGLDERAQEDAIRGRADDREPLGGRR